jgi:hypothetical protein
MALSSAEFPFWRQNSAISKYVLEHILFAATLQRLVRIGGREIVK